METFKGFFLFFFFFFFFLGLHLWHMEVPRVGVYSELQLPIYTTATAIPDPSHILTHWARPGTEPASLWILIGCLPAELQWKLQTPQPFFKINSCNIIVSLYPTCEGFLLVALSHNMAWETGTINTCLLLQAQAAGGPRGNDVLHQTFLWWSPALSCSARFSFNLYRCEPVSRQVLGQAHEGYKSQGVCRQLNWSLLWVSSRIKREALQEPNPDRGGQRQCHLNWDVKCEQKISSGEGPTGRASQAKGTSCTEAHSRERQCGAFDTW